MVPVIHIVLFLFIAITWRQLYEFTNTHKKKKFVKENNIIFPYHIKNCERELCKIFSLQYSIENLKLLLIKLRYHINSILNRVFNKKYYLVFKN